jgi:hypothetical protein
MNKGVHVIQLGVQFIKHNSVYLKLRETEFILKNDRIHTKDRKVYTSSCLRETEFILNSHRVHVKERQSSY